MSSDNPFRRFLHSAAVDLERDLDQLQALLSDPPAPGKLRMLAFAGYRNERELRVSGRIVRFTEALNPVDSTFDKIKAMLSIYNSREVPGVLVRCEALGTSAEQASDEEGYFRFSLPVERPLPSATVWEMAKLSLPDREMQAAHITVPILAPARDDHWGIISDIDDTVIETGATDFLKNWRRILAERPSDRLAVPGAASLYGMIARDHAAPTRPFFYVSSSPWNLYGFLTEFMELNRIPHGPMFLKDLGLDESKFIDAGHETHKLEAIRTILEFYPHHRFLLMGDNGQRDVEIYAEAVQSFPERIGAVFIRDVTGTCGAGEKAQLLAQIAAAGVQTYCAANFADGVSILHTLGIERPVEATRASGEAPISDAR